MDTNPAQKHFLGLSAHGFHRIAYLEWGNPRAARTVVCVHGLVRNAHDFDRLGTALADSLRVISVDMPGRGASDDLGDPALYAYPQYLADITALLARLDIAEVDWIGTSMGGLIGMLLAAQPRTPIRSLILNDVGPFLPAAALARIAAYISNPPHLPDMAAATDYIGKIYKNVGPCTDADRAAFVQHSIRPNPGDGFRLRYDPGIARNFAAATTDIDLWPIYDRITCPTLVLRGALSDVLDEATAKAMTQRGPRAELATIPAIGHFPALMDSNQIEIVQKFLNS